MQKEALPMKSSKSPIPTQSKAHKIEGAIKPLKMKLKSRAFGRTDEYSTLKPVE